MPQNDSGSQTTLANDSGDFPRKSQRLWPATMKNVNDFGDYEGPYSRKHPIFERSGQAPGRKRRKNTPVHRWRGCFAASVLVWWGSLVVRLGLDVTDSDLFRTLRGRHALFLVGVGCLYHPSGKRLTGAVEAFLRNGVTASDARTQKNRPSWGGGSFLFSL